jgi:hypothetical protein
LARRPILNRKIKIKGSLLEVRCEKQLLFAAPSIHKDGNAYEPIGTTEIAILEEMKLLQLEAKIDTLSHGYMSDENKQRYIAWLEDPNTKIKEHEGRHDAIKTLGCSYYYRYNNGWRNLTDDQRHDKLHKWNWQHCIPPLPEKEFNDIWKWIVDRHRKQRDKLREQLEDKRRKAAEERSREFNKTTLLNSYSQDIQNSLADNIWTEVSESPQKWIVADTRKKVIYKAYTREHEETSSNAKQNEPTKIIKRKFCVGSTVIRCIPVSITKHESPLDFLYSQTNYTITFKDTTF